MGCVKTVDNDFDDIWERDEWPPASFALQDSCVNCYYVIDGMSWDVDYLFCGRELPDGLDLSGMEPYDDNWNELVERRRVFPQGKCEFHLHRNSVHDDTEEFDTLDDFLSSIGPKGGDA